MFRRAFEGAVAYLGREPRPARVHPGKGTGNAGRQAAEIATQVFTAIPDVALDRWIHIGRSVNGALTVRRVGSNGEYSIPVQGDHLYETSVDRMRAAATAIMIDAMRLRAIGQEGTRHDPGVVPVWAVTACRPMVDLMRRLGVDVHGDTSKALAERLTRAFTYRSGEASLQMDDGTGRLTGTARAPWEIDRPFTRVIDTPGADAVVEILKAPPVPLSVLANMEGRTLGEVVDLGPLSAEMAITGAVQDDRSLKLTVTGRPTPVRDPPPGIDMRWVDLLE